MSDTILKFISTKPTFIPTNEVQNNTRLFLSKVFDDNKLKFVQTEDVEFIDQGSSFESVSCNYCGKDINIEIWQEAMDAAYQSRFKDLTFVLPCCSKITTLNNLEYYSPAGFAKFAIIISNPKIDIEEAELKELEKILGTDLKKIWAPY